VTSESTYLDSDPYGEVWSENNDLQAHFGQLGLVELFLNHSQYDDPDILTMVDRFNAVMILNGWI
jgi:hypothetical protein